MYQKNTFLIKNFLSQNLFGTCFLGLQLRQQSDFRIGFERTAFKIGFLALEESAFVEFAV